MIKQSLWHRVDALLFATLCAVTWLVPHPADAAEPTDATTLRALATARGLPIGAAVNAAALASDAGYRDRLGVEFGSVTPEDAMKWVVVEPQRGQFSWRQADAVVDFAVQHAQAVRGHTLVWYHSLPDWLTTGSFTTEELRAILKEHIELAMTRYAGRVGIWDVVNEALNEDGTLRPSIWLDRLGPGYLADAFRWARAADPNAKLYINEYNVEWHNAKSDALYALVRDLRAQGVPIDGVGFQTHALVSSQLSQLSRVMRRFAALGLDVAITELDVRMPLPADQAKLSAQAQVYERATVACLSVARCKSITVWGFTDAYSWIPAAYPGWGAADLLDEHLGEKTAYHAVARTLAEWQRSAQEPAGWWWLDDPRGAPAVDSSGNEHHATPLGGGQLGAAGRVPGVTTFSGNGLDSEASTAEQVLRTDVSFTVSAWVRLTDRSEARVIASQDDTEYSVFYLMYQSYTDRWEFTVPSAPSQQLTWQTARSSSVPKIGAWTHLAGVYDAGARELRLYVGGALEGVRTGVTAWQATGPFRIGRSFSGARFAGNISDVRAWNRALATTEISAVADAQVGRWTLDATIGDASWFGRDGYPTPGGISWTTNRAGLPGSALGLDGSGSVDLSGAVLYTNRSYTVAAWVKLADKGGYRVVASQDGTVRDAFYLEYHPSYDRWAFIVPTADTTSSGWQTALSTTVPSVGVWTHLAVVYDAASGQLRLYVNRVRQATVSGVTSWPASGTFHIGRAIVGGWFTGAIDDVRTYSHALTDAEVSRL